MDINVTGTNSTLSPHRVILEDLKPVEFEVLINKIHKLLKLNRISTILICLIILAGAYDLCGILAFVGVILKFYTHTIGAVPINYESADTSVIDIWKPLQTCKKVWEVIAYGTNTKTMKGTDAEYNRSEFIVKNKCPFYLKSNIIPITLLSSEETLIIFPDIMIIVKGIQVGIEKHSSFEYDLRVISYVEESGKPKDAEFVQNINKYMNKNGTPDKRRKENPVFPLLKYGILDFVSLNGLRLQIMCSNVIIAENFWNQITNVYER